MVDLVCRRGLWMYAIFCRGEFVVIQDVVVGMIRRVDGTVIEYEHKGGKPV